MAVELGGRETLLSAVEMCAHGPLGGLGALGLTRFAMPGYPWRHWDRERHPWALGVEDT